ncbi:hypothetical protein KPK_A0033 (plasmid) [Klebsiella variicola]|uniref:Uncharacterized protein n=1 Tax=Klebsiella variicola (strain 342) TaxID=507522 RepID=B5RJV9_KLEV3|nr:hypothetical protein KPK_A0033 [Klebsiella variicola]
MFAAAALGPQAMPEAALLKISPVVSNYLPRPLADTLGPTGPKQPLCSQSISYFFR